MDITIIPAVLLLRRAPPRHAGMLIDQIGSCSTESVGKVDGESCCVSFWLEH